MDIRDIIEQIIKPQIKQPLWESWYIKEKIGSGSFSVVYRIEAQRPGGKDVSALKVEAIMSDGQIFSDSSRKTTFLNSRKQMAINEAQIMKKLRDCPYIVRYEEEHMQEVYINGEFEGYYYLIRMEFLRNVYDLMKKGQFSYSEANVKKLAIEIGQGLQAAHSLGIIHRDIKPDNMFINDAGIYKLGDFNISKKAVSTRTYAGTQYYMAPEIYRARTNVDASYTTQADIYSLGLCLYQMMNKGQLPFEDKLDPDSAYDKRMTNRETFPKPCNAAPAFAKVILKACSFDPNERYRSIDEMLFDLNSLNIKNNTSSNATQYAEDSVSSKSNISNATQYAEDSVSSILNNINANNYALESYFTPKVLYDEKEIQKKERKALEEFLGVEDIAILQKKASENNIAAQHFLGVGYLYGHIGEMIVKKNCSEGMRWLLKAAEQEFSPSQCNLGDIYLVGRFAEKDYKKAFLWYIKAAKRGHINAQFQVARFYENGWGVNRDITQAIFWYKKAADNNSKRAKDALTRLQAAL